MDPRIIESLRAFIPEFPHVEPSKIETKFNAEADSLIVYFTADHTPTYWSELDDYLLLGRKADTDEITGVMVEYFSEWLLSATAMAQRGKMLATV